MSTGILAAVEVNPATPSHAQLIFFICVLLTCNMVFLYYCLELECIYYVNFISECLCHL